MYHFYFHDMKLRYKFMTSHLILFLVPTIVMSMLLYNRFSSILLSNITQSELSISRQTVSAIETSITQVHAASSTITQDPDFTQMLQTDSQTISTQISKNPDFLRDMQTFLISASAMIDDINITNIKIYLDTTFETMYTNPELTNYNIFRPISDIQGSYWHGILSSIEKRTLVCPSLYLTRTETENYGEYAVVKKLTYYSDAEKTAAYVVVYFSKENIESILRKNITLTGSASYIINDWDSLVSSSSMNLSGKYFLSSKLLDDLIPDTTKFSTKDFALEKTYINYKEINGTDWYMVSVIPVNSVFQQNRDFLWKFILAYMAFVVAAFLVSQQLSNSIARRIATVIDQMREVRKGTPSPIVRKLEHDEIGDLIDTYNFMTSEIQNFMEKEVKAADDLRISEFKALQSQINPHFLYNTLDMISWLAKSGKGEDVSRAVQALSKFYKLTLGKGNVTVSIRDELTHVSLYVQLQNMRYKDKIHFFIDVPDDMLDYEIPKLVLQPIVENSIQHGIFGKESKEGNIVITGWSEGRTLVFIISDDGVGIPAAKLDAILMGNGESRTGSNIGIYNTHQRLKLFYGEEFGLTYKSTPNVETSVEICIPAKLFTEASTEQEF